MSDLPGTFQPFENLRTGLKIDDLQLYKSTVEGILNSRQLIFDQKKAALAHTAMNVLPYPSVSEEALQLVESGVVCLLSEGAAPFHPRYVAPDYGKLLRDGSSFLEIKPPQDLFEAIGALLTAYKYAPNGGEPVFIGRMDELLEPFADSVPEHVAYQLMRTFWQLVDRLYPSAFVHANLGPAESRIGNIILDVDNEIRPITNLTLRYDPSVTPDTFAEKAVLNALKNAKPYFLNHPMMVADWGEDYAVASCYNGMRLGGGIYTLVRLNIKKAAALAKGLDDFLNRVLPDIFPGWMELIESRSRRIIEDADWFSDNYWIEEGYLAKEKFTSYAGIFGLAEGVAALMDADGHADAKYGHDAPANQTAQAVTDRIRELLEGYAYDFCSGSGGIPCYHAQVGIMEDVDVSPATRIPSGQEPALYDHLTAEAPTHAHILGGTSTILEFDQTAEKNPGAVLDIIKGAFSNGTRNLSIGSASSEFVRVTGYLIRRADLEAAQQEKTLRHGSAHLGAGFMKTKPNHLHRITRKV